MLSMPSGLKRVSELYLMVPSYDQDTIDQAYATYLLQNNLVPFNVIDIIPKALIELLIERMATVIREESESNEPFTKDNIVEKMTKTYLKAHHDLKLNLINFRKMLDTLSWLYRYCLR